MWRVHSIVCSFMKILTFVNTPEIKKKFPYCVLVVNWKSFTTFIAVHSYCNVVSLFIANLTAV